jgi:hypothetical protein
MVFTPFPPSGRMQVIIPINSANNALPLDASDIRSMQVGQVRLTQPLAIQLAHTG